MNELVEEQVLMFKEILERPLTKDEVYLIRNSFQNGFAQGREDKKKDIIKLIEKS